MGFPVLSVAARESQQHRVALGCLIPALFLAAVASSTLDCLKAIKAGGELHSWNRLSHCLVVLGNQALQKAVLHFFRCLDVSAVTELLKAH